LLTAGGAWRSRRKPPVNPERARADDWFEL